MVEFPGGKIYIPSERFLVEVGYHENGFTGRSACYYPYPHGVPLSKVPLRSKLKIFTITNLSKINDVQHQTSIFPIPWTKLRTPKKVENPKILLIRPGPSAIFFISSVFCAAPPLAALMATRLGSPTALSYAWQSLC